MEDEISVVIPQSTVNLTIVESPVDLTLDLNSFQASGVVSYTHTQQAASNRWTINHNLGYKPVVQLFNSGSACIFGEIIHTSNNQVMVYFTKPITGFARLI